MKEIKLFGPLHVPIILCGLKSDLRDEMDGEQAVSTEQGREAQEKMEFFAYVETSAKLFDNCGEVFTIAVEVALLKKTILSASHIKEAKMLY